MRGDLGGQVVKQASRQEHARRRQRGPHGRFLGAKAAANYSNTEERTETSDCNPQAQQTLRKPQARSERNSPVLSCRRQSSSSSAHVPQQPRGRDTQPQYYLRPPLPQELSLTQQRMLVQQQLPRASTEQGVPAHAPQVNGFESGSGVGAIASAISSAAAAPQVDSGMWPVTSQQLDDRKAFHLKSMSVLSHMLIKHQLAFQKLQQAHAPTRHTSTIDCPWLPPTSPFSSSTLQ